MARKERIEDLGRIRRLIEEIHNQLLLAPAVLHLEDFIERYNYNDTELEELFNDLCDLRSKIEQIYEIAKGESS